MIELAINILWLLLGIVALLCVVWVALYVIKLFCPIPDRVEQAIWAIVLILCLIGALSLLASGGRVPFRTPSFSKVTLWELPKKSAGLPEPLLMR
jgi:hypothetical protein